MSEYDYPETRTQHRKQRLNDVDHGFPFKKDRQSFSHYHRSSFVPGTHTSQDVGHTRSLSREPVETRERPRERSRSSTSHSRSLSEQVIHSSDQCMPPVPVVPPQPWSKQWIVPSVIPPGYPKDTTWVYNSSGWPQPAAPEQYSVGNPPVVRLKEQSRNPGGSTCRSQFDQAIARCGRETTPFSRECTPLSRAKPNNSHDPRRSRSSSHSRSNQVAPFLDAIISPVPPIPKNPSRQQKLFPIPTVLPPGYPEDSRWVVDLSGRPRIETPHQYQERYGLHPPAIAPVRQVFPQNITPHPLSATESQSSFTRQSLTESTQSPAIAFQSPQKPIFKRIFGGIIGNSKRAKTPGPKEPPPPSHLSNSSQWSFRTNPRARTKSM